MTRAPRRACLALALALAAPGTALAAAAPVGHWEGAITLFGNDIGIQVDFTGRPDSLAGTIDIAGQGVNRAPLKGVRASGDSVLFALAMPGVDASFAGVQRGDSLTGAFRQAGLSAPFRLARGAELAKSAAPPPPYPAEEVVVPSAGLTLAGTLTRPPGPGPHPAVVLVTGSGPQNRDEEIVGFRPFAVIADRLTRDGIAVLRMDDRGVGRSGGEFRAATSLDFADDLAAGVRFLRARREIDPRRIGALGHSEGGIVAPLLAARSDSLAFLVLLAPPGIRGDSLLVVQGELITAAMGMNDSLLALQRRAQALLIRASRTGEGWDPARDATRAVLARLYAVSGVAVPDSMIDAQADAQVADMRSDWMRSFLLHDPAPVLTRVRQPVLVLFGEHDLQVPPSANAPAIERALARHRDATVRVIPRTNHLFQQTDSGNPALYPMLPKEFAPGVLDTISSWIRVRTARVGAKPATRRK